MAKILRLLTFGLFAERHEAFPESTLRWLKYRSEPVKRTRRGKGGEQVVEDLPPNGFADAFVKVGGRLLIDEKKFFEIVAAQNGRSADAASA
jgi:hypothetical protein